MELQQIIVYTILGLAILFLVRKFIFKSKNEKGCGPDCGC
jgi:predicted small secreted protein